MLQLIISLVLGSALCQTILVSLSLCWLRKNYLGLIAGELFINKGTAVCCLQSQNVFKDQLLSISVVVNATFSLVSLKLT